MWKNLTNEGFYLASVKRKGEVGKPAAGLLFYAVDQNIFMQKTELEEIAAFIREHRSKEENFEKLLAKLSETESVLANGTVEFDGASIRAKADEYQKAKELGGTAWPEFEKFVTEFERSITGAMKEEK